MFRILLLVLAAFIWGLGFVGTRWTFMDYSAIWSNSLRFLFAGSIALPFLIYKKPQLFKNKGIILCALLLGAGLQLQTIGIELTTLAKSGFLTVFYAIFTPMIMLLFFRARFKSMYWVLVSIALLGIAMICEFSLSNFNKGDAYILMSAILFAMHIVATDRYAQKENAILFNLGQCFYIGVFCLAFGLIYEGPVSLSPLLSLQALYEPSSLWGFIILSVFSSIIAFSLQVYAQQGIAPHIVSLIFLLESIFATLFGYLFFQEKLTMLAGAGCLLVLVSVAFIPICTNYKKSSKKTNKMETLNV